MSGYQAGYQHFNSDDPRYQCCCGCCRAKSGTLLIALLDGVICSGNLVWLLYHNLKYSMLPYGTVPTHYWPVFYGSTAVCGFAFLSVVLCLIGVCSERAGFLIVYLAWRVVNCLLMVVSVVFCIVLLAAGKSTLIDVCKRIVGNDWFQYETQYGAEVVANAAFYAVIALLVIFVLSFLVSIWFFAVVKAAYIYLSDKRRATQHLTAYAAAQAPQMQQQQQQQQQQQVYPGIYGTYGGPPAYGYQFSYDLTNAAPSYHSGYTRRSPHPGMPPPPPPAKSEGSYVTGW